MTSLREVPGWRVLALTAVLLFAGLAVVGPRGGSAAHASPSARVFGGRCFGAAALSPGRRCPAPSGQPVPSPQQAPDDLSAAYQVRANGRDCWSHAPQFARSTCRFGSKHGRTKVVLVGNSHAGEWLPALQRIAKKEHWRIVTELASSCAMSDVTQMFAQAVARHHCRAWARHAAVRIRRDRPDLIVFSNRMSLPAKNHTRSGSVHAYAAGMVRLMRRWTGIPVVVIRDTPAPSESGGPAVPACLMAHPDDYAACNGSRSAWIAPDPGVAAARHFGNVRVANLNDHICGRATCAAIVGGVTVYVDGSHMTATYARTLAPYLRPFLVAALRHAHHGHQR